MINFLKENSDIANDIEQRIREKLLSKPEVEQGSNTPVLEEVQL